MQSREVSNTKGLKSVAETIHAGEEVEDEVLCIGELSKWYPEQSRSGRVATGDVGRGFAIGGRGR